MLLGGFLSDNPESGQNTEGAQKISAAKTVRPFLRKKIFKSSKREISWNKM